VIVPDVNVLVHAWEPSSPEHVPCREWLEAAANSTRTLGLQPVVSSGCVRVLTHPRIFRQPAPAAAVLERIAALRRRPNVVELFPGPRAWELFAELCRVTAARGNEVPDAYIAAVTIEHGGTLVSADRGLSRFPGLDVRHPFDG
jgi:uncharacterized protein